MCGIVGFIGKNAKTQIIDCLKKLEYRGYDSSGLALINNKDKIEIIKETGFISNIENLSNNMFDDLEIGIGHTRWATTGKVTKENAHPHVSNNGRFAIVHNGIIENYEAIKSDLSHKGYTFSSETDSEVVAILLEENAKTAKSVIENIKLTTKILEGSFSLAILDTHSPDKIFATKKDMPLFVSAGADFASIASAVVGLPHDAIQYIMLENHDIAEISLNTIKVWQNEEMVDRRVQKITKDDLNHTMHNHKHYMIKEIFEEQVALEKTAEAFSSLKPSAKKEILDLFASHKRIHLVACGTAYHACLVGASLLESIGFDCSCHIASEFKYFPPNLNDKCLCIFVSQSGETADTIGCLKLVQEKGIKCLSITNVESSTIAHISDHLLMTKAGTEVAVASTKAYNCQCLIFYLLTQAISKNNQVISIKNLKIDKILQTINQISKLSQIIATFKKVFFIGRGLDSLTAKEGSLKLKEITYIPSESYPAGELKHGTLSLVDDESLSIVILTQKSKIHKKMKAVSEIKARGGFTLVVTPFDEIQPNHEIDYVFHLPILKNEQHYPLISIIPLQLFAYFTSIEKGINPDKPRNLAKSVTVE